VDLLAWSDFNENYANDSTTDGKRTFHAAAAPQLDCSSSHYLENVQVCRGASIVDVFAKCEYKVFFSYVNDDENLCEKFTKEESDGKGS
jgi:hypothetical protein